MFSNCFYKGYEHSSHGGEHHFETQQYDKGSFKEMGLRDLFDIALTTLAFLSFGMFLLQVLMCVTMVSTTFIYFSMLLI